MKYFRLSIVLIIIIASFLFFNKGISKHTVHKLIKSDFRIEASFSGCFGGGTKTAVAFRKDGKRWLKVTESSWEHYESSTTEFTPEKESQLESDIIDALKNPEIDGSTTFCEYRIDNNSFGFNFGGGRCWLAL